MLLEDFRLDYDEATFTASVGLSGWLVKGGTNKVIIQSRFRVQCSHSGYTPDSKGLIKIWDRNISFLNQAKSNS